MALPAFLEALGVEMTMEDLQEMQPLYRLGHWKDMLLGLKLDSGDVIGLPPKAGNTAMYIGP